MVRRGLGDRRACRNNSTNVAALPVIHRSSQFASTIAVMSARNVAPSSRTLRGLPHAPTPYGGLS